MVVNLVLGGSEEGCLCRGIFRCYLRYMECFDPECASSRVPASKVGFAVSAYHACTVRSSLRSGVGLDVWPDAHPFV